jgi:hypothetical protein
MPKSSLVAPLFVLAVLFFSVSSSAQSVQGGLTKNPCTQIAFEKSVAADIVGNPVAFENLGFLQLACAVANTVNLAPGARESACALEIAAGDAFVTAAGVQFSEGPMLPGQPDIPASVRARSALEDWGIASKAYSKAITGCTGMRMPDGTDPLNAAGAKEANALNRIAELVREIARE